MDRSENLSATVEGVVPVAIDIHAPSNRPNISRRDPDPTNLRRRPVSRAPHIVAILIHPVSGNPEVIIRWRGTRGPDFLALWWGRVVLGFGCRFGSKPCTRHPLVAVFHFRPVTRLPFATRRRLTPQPANPKEIVEFLIEMPITR